MTRSADHLIPPPPPGSGDTVVVREAVTTVLDRLRYEAAKAALQGMLSASPESSHGTTSTEAYAKRAVRYADALLDVLNATTAEAMHARRR